MGLHTHLHVTGELFMWLCCIKGWFSSSIVQSTLASAWRFFFTAYVESISDSRAKWLSGSANAASGPKWVIREVMVEASLESGVAITHFGLRCSLWLMGTMIIDRLWGYWSAEAVTLQIHSVLLPLTQLPQDWTDGKSALPCPDIDRALFLRRIRLSLFKYNYFCLCTVYVRLSPRLYLNSCHQEIICININPSYFLWILIRWITKHGPTVCHVLTNDKHDKKLDKCPNIQNKPNMHFKSSYTH